MSLQDYINEKVAAHLRGTQFVQHCAVQALYTAGVPLDHIVLCTRQGDPSEWWLKVEAPRREPGPWMWSCQNPRADLTVKVWSCGHWRENRDARSTMPRFGEGRWCTAQDAQRAPGETET